MTRRGRRRAWLLAAAALASAVALPACSASAPTPSYYVSLGDSYSVGYQPSPPRATGGYTAVVATGLHATLENFGCGGATTTSILRAHGCTVPYGPAAASGAVRYPDASQAAAAEAFLRAHRGHVSLVTVSIGGNDITRCAVDPNPVGCVTAALPLLEANVTSLARALRAAAGRGVPLVGLTYPDVILGLWVFPPGAPNRGLATLSVTAFRSIINPALSSSYTRAGGIFVDVTAASGAYIPLGDTTTLAPYGTVPLAVARVCALTWYCSEGNIHATTAGYDLIGQQILAALHRHR